MRKGRSATVTALKCGKYGRNAAAGKMSPKCNAGADEVLTMCSMPRMPRVRVSEQAGAAMVTRRSVEIAAAARCGARTRAFLGKMVCQRSKTNACCDMRRVRWRQRKQRYVLVSEDGVRGRNGNRYGRVNRHRIVHQVQAHAVGVELTEGYV